VKVVKSSLVAMLLEGGEENAAVLVARSDLPEHVDTERDLDVLLDFGLDRDQLDEVARMSIGEVEPEDGGTRRRRDELEKTISRRWADLVVRWTT
jgi:hypothetical protein